MKSKILPLLMLLGIVLAGCIERTVSEEEPILTKFQDIGVLLFAPGEQNVLTGEIFPVVLHIRNNALGKEAKDLTVSLENVKPLILLDCNGRSLDLGNEDAPADFNQTVDPNTVRTPNAECILEMSGVDPYCPIGYEEMISGDGTVAGCGILTEVIGGADYIEGDPADPNYVPLTNVFVNAFDQELDLDAFLTYREHGLTSIENDLEKTFYWILQAPNETVLGAAFNHVLYYTINYEYKTTTSYSIVFLAQEERSELAEEGITIPKSNTETTAGAISVEPLIEDQLKFYTQANLNPVQYIGFKLKNDGYGYSGNAKVTFTYNPEQLQISMNDLQDWDYCGIEGGETGTIGRCEKQIDTSELITESSIQRIPIILHPDERTTMVENNIPIAIYIAQIEIEYPYTIDGYTSISIKSPYI